MSGPWIAVIVAQWVVVVVLALTQIGTLRKLLPLLERAAAFPPGPSVPPMGTLLPEFAATLGNGSTITAAQLLGRPFVLLFVRQACEPCRRLLLNLEGRVWPAQNVTAYVVMDREACVGLPIPKGLTPLLERGGSISRTLRVNVAPLAVAVDGGGIVIESLVPESAEDLDRLVQSLQTDYNRVPGRGGKGMGV